MTDVAVAPTEVAPDTTDAHAPRWRLVLSVVLLVLTVILAPLAVVAGWAKSQIVDTDRYVKTVAPLADEPAVQQYVATALSDAIVSRLDASAFVQEQLPSQLAPLAPTVNLAITSVIDRAALRFTESPAFKTLWVEANRAAHKVVVKVLTGSNRATDLSNGQLTLDLGTALERFQTYLVARGVPLVDKVDLSKVDRTIVLADGPQLKKLETARKTVGALKKLVWVLAVLTLACAAGSVLVAARKRRALVRLAVGLALSMVLVAIGVAVARRAFLSALQSTMPSDVGSSLFDAVTASMRAGFRSIFVVGLIIAVLVAITALPSYATRLARPTQVGVGALGVVALLARDDLRPSFVVFVIVLTVVAVGVLELERRRRLGAPPTPSAPAAV